MRTIIQHHLNLIAFNIFLTSNLRFLLAQTHHTHGSPMFPGVSRDIQSFCSARPSLPIDLAPMIVHVKKSTSFNYKLYLFSGQDYVFQTGQIVPRDDFRIHSFPVKVKRFNEFWPEDVPVIYLNETDKRNRSTTNEGKHFKRAQFLSLVPSEETTSGEANVGNESRTVGPRKRKDIPDLHGEPLPGDREYASMRSNHREERTATSQSGARSLNEHIQFDRDDQVALLNKRSNHGDNGESLELSESSPSSKNLLHRKPSETGGGPSRGLLPVGAFSSFHVNSTYLVRKDFNQTACEIIRIIIDPFEFKVVEVQLFGDILWGETVKSERTRSVVQLDELAFLGHKLLRDPMVRIVSINQLYEDWITRNFYTVVYIQRKLPHADDPEVASGKRQEIITERLLFRGSSSVLLGADQLDYLVGASAFITEKNGLHYYLEFLAEKKKFLLGAIDWSKRPFKIIDSKRFPMKQTRTLYDNEELLLCPPSVCYSEQPIDELVAYGRIELDDPLLRQTLILSKTSSTTASHLQHETTLATIVPFQDRHDSLASMLVSNPQLESAQEAINLEKIVSELRKRSQSLQTQLHLRDWTWTLERSRFARLSADSSATKSERPPFKWLYDKAKRNEVKALKDTYGFPLAGHDIDASFRVFNELYLVSSNQLISINYTQANETSVSSRSISEEFPGLSSTPVDPITAAFYERQMNQVFFFKGDRYVAYDYASKRPLEEFQLPAIDQSNGAPSSDHSVSRQRSSRPLVSTLPVISILGRQLNVDAIYHDALDDRVYIFAGMKFYSYHASDFRDGAFRLQSGRDLPPLKCINKHFITGCQFDAAYPNPCHEDEPPHDESNIGGKSAKIVQAPRELKLSTKNEDNLKRKQEKVAEFNQQQQNRLRSIATSRQSSLLDTLMGNSLIEKGVGSLLLTTVNESHVSSVLLPSDRDRFAEERIVLYLLVAMVAITIIITTVMIYVIVRWTASGHQDEGSNDSRNVSPQIHPGIRPTGNFETVYPKATHLHNVPTSFLDFTSPMAQQQVAGRTQKVRPEQRQPSYHYATGWLGQVDNRGNLGSDDGHPSGNRRQSSSQRTLSEFSAFEHANEQLHSNEHRKRQSISRFPRPEAKPGSLSSLSKSPQDLIIHSSAL